MITTANAEIFVAEVGIRVAIHGGLRVRKKFEHPDGLGIVRGFWTPWHVPAAGSDVPRPLGIKATIEIVGNDLMEAEDQTLEFANRIGTVWRYHAGSPSLDADLIRIARVDAKGFLREQWNYYYDSAGPPSIALRATELVQFTNILASVDTPVRTRMESAAHWYVSALSDRSVVDAYLAAWVGFECLEHRLGDLFHPSGPKAPCTVCQNIAGEKRDRGVAGFEHLLKRVAPELVSKRSFDDLADIRNRIAHGLSSHEELTADATEVLPDLLLALAKAILVARDGIADERTFGWLVAGPRDAGHRPDARLRVLPPAPLPAHAPFLGGWISVERTYSAEEDSVDDDGVVNRKGKVAFMLRMNTRGSTRAEAQRDYQLFERSGIKSWLEDLNTAEGVPVDVVPWRKSPPPNNAWRGSSAESQDQS